MDFSERLRRLSSAGIEVIELFSADDGRVTPVSVASAVTSCGADSGRVDRAIDDADPDRIVEGNAAWAELAQQFSLSGSDGTFLLAIDTAGGEDSSYEWFRVRLTDQWDLMGRGAAEGVLGGGWGIPEFRMHSLDGEVLLAASWYETCFSVLAVPRPYRAAVLRGEAEYLLTRRPSAGREALLRRWLARGAG
ncbi:hypothetical protein ACTOB_008351 [Actinoplanes oblitus]|uniref:Uncharacterized protein n=1 Tax=Actinoplanes oblitus TaxID=3040509 RepID=A0ABY8WGL0_9ACTN|nr:hypothetical protein [Actinoplanes oblitus]WIM96183.1 hypothetical protein ACTOB_008351 [Actinoplanes oblitus]